MEYTVEFYKTNVGNGRTMIHETTLCESDETTLKREVTKIAKTLDEFRVLQAESPIPWDNWGYDPKSFIKRWTPYEKNFPLESDQTYSIHVFQTSSLFETARKKVYDAKYKVREALKELTDRKYSFDPDISKIDPEIAEIIGADLPIHVQALIDLFDGATKRLTEKVEELNERE